MPLPHRVLTVALIASLALSTSGCFSYTTVPMGRLMTPGVRIEAQNGDFKIESGKPFTPPFQSNPMILTIWKDQNGLYGEYKDHYKQWRESGGRQVKVFVPGRTEPLYGILMLNRIPDNSDEQGAQSYRLEIPEKYIQAASGGRISSVYEFIKFGKREHSQEFPLFFLGFLIPFLFPISATVLSGSGTAITWILWLSDVPFQ